ncbi:MAG: hypothetical protein M3Q10_20080 [Chloroflexota bacterium]|nr:hypothetical protein [Chloroflexota bacterium]
MVFCEGKRVRVERDEVGYQGLIGTVYEVDEEGVWVVLDDEPDDEDEVALLFDVEDLAIVG